MIYGTKELKNGKRVGYLRFETHKVVRLDPEEVIEYENKIREYQLLSRKE